LRTAVIDSTPLINLVHLELVSELSLFFDVIYVPRHVQIEVNRKHRFRYLLRELLYKSILERCAIADKTNVALLRLEIDEGEAEALVQAQEKGAAFFIGDDRRAREIAEAQGLKAVGTVGILARLRLEGRADETTVLVKKLRAQVDFRVSDEIVAQAIATAVEPL
jgi:predicted nucleic acid-binding protein